MSSSSSDTSSNSDNNNNNNNDDMNISKLVVDQFLSYLAKQPDMAIAVAAIQALTYIVQICNAKTMMELEVVLQSAADALKNTRLYRSSISLGAGCELFNRYVTRTSLELGDFQRCKRKLIERGTYFTAMTLKSRKKISEFGDRFIRDGSTIFMHGRSRVVISILLHAAREQTKYFTVIMTEGRPVGAGAYGAELLTQAGIPVTIVLDSACGYMMEQADLVLVGAEAVVENGGIINQIGTCTLAMVAKATNTPFYVAAESYKFARIFPLTQAEIPDNHAEKEFYPDGIKTSEKLKICNPRCDYTPPSYITLLFTDLGILTPSAVSDELIKLYY